MMPARVINLAALYTHFLKCGTSACLTSSFNTRTSSTERTANELVGVTRKVLVLRMLRVKYKSVFALSKWVRISLRLCASTSPGAPSQRGRGSSEQRGHRRSIPLVQAVALSRTSGSVGCVVHKGGPSIPFSSQGLSGGPSFRNSPRRLTKSSQRCFTSSSKASSANSFPLGVSPRCTSGSPHSEGSVSGVFIKLMMAPRRRRPPAKAAAKGPTKKQNHLVTKETHGGGAHRSFHAY